jgi:outer membrane protein OmpA-like peptidoglycan-associated protein
LERYLKILNEKPELLMEIAGHATDFGDDHAANLELSQKRAQAVVEHLVKNGISRERLRAMGYGDKFNIADNNTEDGKKLNTRTELIIYHNLKQGKAPESKEGFYTDLANTTDDKGLNPVLKLRREATLANGTQVAELTKQYLAEKEKNVYLPSGLNEEQKAKAIEEKVASGKLKSVVLKGKMVEVGTNMPLAGVVKLTNANNKKVAEVKADANGNYIIKTNFDTEKSCILSVQKDGYNFAAKSFFIPANSDEKVEIENNFFLKKLSAGTKFVLRNVYYNYNMTSLRSESFHELEQLEAMMKKNPNVVIEVSGHTDAKGDAYYNKILSERRAQSVVDFLVSKGIAKARLVVKGYGEERPLASNDDELEGRELNRRTEIIILKN